MNVLRQRPGERMKSRKLTKIEQRERNQTLVNQAEKEQIPKDAARFREITDIKNILKNEYYKT